MTYLKLLVIALASGSCLLGQLTANEEDVSIMEIQQKYVEENGGFANILSISSVAAFGTMQVSSGKELKFNLYRKRPNLSRFHLEVANGAQITLFDGENAYKIFEDFTSVVKVDRLALSEDEIEEVKLEGALENIFYQLRGRPECFEFIATEEVNGVEAYKFVISEKAKVPYPFIWIDKENYQEVMRRRISENEDGDPVFEDVQFSNFVKISGFWRPKKIVYRKDGVITQILLIDRYRMNVGVYDNFFKAPVLKEK